MFGTIEALEKREANRNNNYRIGTCHPCIQSSWILLLVDFVEMIEETDQHTNV